MDINPISHISFLNGVSSYEKMQYQNAIRHFVQSLTNQLIDSNPPAPQHSSPTHITLNQLCSSLQLPSFQSLANLSSCLIKTKQYLQAEQVCSFLFKLNPYMSLPYYNMASIFIRQEKYRDAVGMIKCGISCEYLRKYERMFEKEDLDQAIQYAANSLNAIKYRIAHNLQYLNFIKKTSSIEYDLTQEIQKALDELQRDNTAYSKYKNIYEVKFYESKQSKNEKFFISTVKPPFILETIYQTIDQDSLNIKGHHSDIERKLALMKQLKELRDLYLQLLELNQHQLDLTLLQEEFGLQNYIHIISSYQNKFQKDQSEKSIYQRYQLNNLIDQNQSSHKNNTIETSCELHDSSFSRIAQNCHKRLSASFSIKQQLQKNYLNNHSHIHKRTLNSRSSAIRQFSINNNKILNKSLRNTSAVTQNIKKNKQNLRSTQNTQTKNKNYLQKNSLISLRAKRSKNLPNHLSIPEYKYINEATEEQELKTSRNKLPTPIKGPNSRISNCQSSCQSACDERANLNSSIISILDYDESSSRFSTGRNYQQGTSIVESIVVHPPKECKGHENNRPSIDQMDFHLIKNRSHENLFTSNILSDTTKKLSHSRYDPQETSLMIDSKSHMKLLSCSKCSIDHSPGEENLQKNVKLNINLTEVYNFPGDLLQLQTFCVVKHFNQTLRTQLSKGRFPNWKHPLSLYVQNLDDLSCQTQEKRIIKIQLWAKSINHKKDSSNLSLYCQKIVGQQTIDLKEEKWAKKKIILEKGEKKTAYMYISLEKSKEKL